MRPPQQNKVRKKEIPEAMVVLLASAEDYRRPCSVPTFELVPNPLVLKRIEYIGSGLIQGKVT